MKNKIKILLCLIMVFTLLIPNLVFAENEDPFVKSFSPKPAIKMLEDENPNIRTIKPNTAKTDIMVYEDEDPYIRNTTQYTAIKMLVDDDEPYALFDWFTHIKFYYDQGYYTYADVRVFVEKGKITPEQYTEITGQPY